MVNPETPVIDVIEQEMTGEWDVPEALICTLCHGEWHGLATDLCPGAWATPEQRRHYEEHAAALGPTHLWVPVPWRHPLQDRVEALRDYVSDRALEPATTTAPPAGAFLAVLAGNAYILVPRSPDAARILEYARTEEVFLGEQPVAHLLDPEPVLGQLGQLAARYPVQSIDPDVPISVGHLFTRSHYRLQGFEPGRE